MLLAELNIRHTRRHMPTRRVAIDHGYLPTSGSAFGGVLLGAVVAEHLSDLDEEQFDALDRLVGIARRELTVPRIALRYRLQRDTHGLDLSRHRIVSADVEHGSTRPVLELDLHGPSAPQVIGALMAASQLPSAGRTVAFRFIDDAIARHGSVPERKAGALPEGLEVRRLFEGLPGVRPPSPGTQSTVTSGREEWQGIPSERRWAMEVLGLHAGLAIERNDVQKRFRRLVRLAHPDHGAAGAGAAERIAELTEARELLLGVIASAGTGRAG